ncbi:DUF1565 domain-containing protein [Microcoleus sp.]|uniref:DUF1565 domain-containing protein n=1 Tax=Microcoleus sp. TaxID=44472 RepID=UPI003523AB11
MRLAENQRLTEKNPSSPLQLNFDRMGETRLTDRLCFFMLIYSKQSGYNSHLEPFSISLSGTSKIPSPHQKLLFLEQASCLFLKKLQDLRYTGRRSPSKALSSCLLLLFATFSLFKTQQCAIATETPIVQIIAQAQQPEINILYVSSSGGSDTTGNGSDRDPFKTLTYALSVAPPNTAILLAPGTYSAQTGEQFPLILQPNVIVQGNPNTRGQNIVIKGGGDFLSPTSAGQNITILGASGARLSGVTVTNPNYRGYALWIESSSPTVVNNTFLGSTHDGISVVGNSRPMITGNLFSKNGANGMTIYGTSQPEVRDNVFENTGFGVNVAEKASPLLIGNQITRNKDGVVVQAEATPVLRNNYIERNQRDGIVAIARALPDLGTMTEPGGNVIRNNGQHDVNNAAKGQLIQAYGNQLLSNRTTGQVQVAGTFNSPLSIGGHDLGFVAQPPRSGGPDSSLPVYTTAPLTPRTQRSPQRPLSPLSASPAQNRSASGQTRLSPLLAPPSASPSAIAIPVPAPNSRSVAEIAVPSPILPPNLDSAIPVPADGKLPVPSRNIPLGRGGYVPAALGGNSLPNSLPNSVANSGENAPSFDRALALGFRYRVVVDAQSQSDRARMQSLVPDAFRTFSNGRAVMQAGAFREQEKAEELLQMLTANGLNARIEEIKE